MALENYFELSQLTEMTGGLDELLLAHALGPTACGITVADARKSQLPLVYCNEVFTQITGYVAEEVIGQNCRFLQGADTSPEVVDEIRAALRMGQPLKTILKNYRKDKSPFWNELILSPVHDKQGEVVYFIGIQNDITAQKEDQDALHNLNRELDERIHERTKELLDALRAAAESREEALLIVGLTLEYRDYETKGHTERVTQAAVRVGEALGLEPESIHILRWGSFLHDAGKIAIPDDILLKPSELTFYEFALMKRHVLIGEEMLKNFTFLPPEVLEAVRHHHERWDGTGYPDGLEGKNIPLLARIFSVVDVYDALTSERPYKRSWSHAEAVAEIKRQSGIQFDPYIVDVFVSLYDESHIELATESSR